MKAFIGILGLSGVLAGAEVLSIAHPEEDFDVRRSVVWTPTFQAGWDAMNEGLGGPPKESGSELGKRLDTFRWEPEKVMPQGRWKVWSGEATRDFFLKVNGEAADFLGEDRGPFREVEGARPGAVAFYSLLDAQVAFVKPFYRSRKVPLEFKSMAGTEDRVSFFGVMGEDSGDYRDEVRVLAWRRKAGFHAVELRCRQEEFGSVVLYQPPGRQDFAAACRWLRVWRKGWHAAAGENAGLHSDPALHSGDRLQIPYLKLSAQGDFKEALQGGRFYGRPGDPYVVNAARQRVEFALHERGAEVRAAAEGGMDPFGAAPRTVPRDLVYDRPFFVFLWRDGAEWPYFGAWVGDSAAMVEFED